MLTGVGRTWVCQPEAVSPLKVTVAIGVPAALQMRPTCVPVSPGSL